MGVTQALVIEGVWFLGEENGEVAADVLVTVDEGEVVIQPHPTFADADKVSLSREQFKAIVKLADSVPWMAVKEER